MVADDSSALMAILLEEPDAESCSHVLETADAIAMSSVTLAEDLIVAAGRSLVDEMDDLIERTGVTVVIASPVVARRAAAAYRAWRNGSHPAFLNFVDCFSCEVAQTHDCPLLFVGNDFSRTDLTSAR